MDTEKHMTFENEDDPNLIRNGNPPDIKSPATASDINIEPILDFEKETGRGH